MENFEQFMAALDDEELEETIENMESQVHELSGFARTEVLNAIKKLEKEQKRRWDKQRALDNERHPPYRCPDTGVMMFYGDAGY